MSKVKTDGPNYSLRFTVSDVASILKVEKANVKKWSHLFAEFLSPAANSKDGSPAQFSTTDLAVLGYVSFYWEPDPDIDSIKLSIHAEEHFGFPFFELIQQATPIFRNVTDDIENLNPEETVYFGGLVDFGNWYQLAKAYKLAGDLLVENSIKNEMGYELICPIIFNYRHATELFLKSTLKMSEDEMKEKIGHNLLKAASVFETKVREEFGEELPDWFKNVVRAFDDFDRKGETFRYGKLQVKDEMLVDLTHLRENDMVRRNI
jgi:hypothetical protein